MAAYQAARHPETSVILRGGHFDVYDNEGFVHSSSAAASWFGRHLL
ncbi:MULTISPECIES: hypothetical protein [Nocardiaceae]|nr:MULTISPECIES: hypothetical protein [Rhodococcus]